MKKTTKKNNSSVLKKNSTRNAALANSGPNLPQKKSNSHKFSRTAVNLSNIHPPPPTNIGNFASIKNVTSPAAMRPPNLPKRE